MEHYTRKKTFNFLIRFITRRAFRFHRQRIDEKEKGKINKKEKCLRKILEVRFGFLMKNENWSKIMEKHEQVIGEACNQKTESKEITTDSYCFFILQNRGKRSYVKE